MSEDLNFIVNQLNETRILNFIFIIVGIFAIAFALIFLWIIKYSFFKGMAIPLLILGIIQVSIGSTAYFKIRKHISQIEQKFKQEPENMKLTELIRTENLIKNLHLYQFIELALLIFGIILYIKFRKSPLNFWRGFAIGLVSQAAITSTIVTVTENTTQHYLHTLK